MKNISIGKWFLLLGIFILTFAVIGAIEYDSSIDIDISYENIKLFMSEDLKLVNFHYYLLIWVIWIK